MPRKAASMLNQPFRLTRARAKLSGNPNLMDGLDDRGKPKSALPEDPDAITYGEVLKKLRKMDEEKEVIPRRSETPEPEDRPKSEDQNALPSPSAPSPSTPRIKQEQLSSPASPAPAPSTPAPAVPVPSTPVPPKTPSVNRSSYRNLAVGDEREASISPTLTQRRFKKLAPIKGPTDGTPRRPTPNLPPISQLNLPRINASSFGVDPFNSRPAPGRPTRAIPKTNVDFDSSDGSSGGTVQAQRIVRIKREMASPPNFLSIKGTPSSASMSGCSDDEVSKRKRPEHDIGTGKLGRRRRPSEQKFFFYDTQGDSKEEEPPSQKNKKARTGSSSRQVVPRSPRIPENNYSFYGEDEFNSLQAEIQKKKAEMRSSSLQFVPRPVANNKNTKKEKTRVKVTPPQP
ncbi:hypothetical protein B0J13DRAFT_290034 [Dactylonectria estremocensis]|uniref:Uncharacterized protein n=1 Tax=Dactylonectria estremocensis TaxID=1079267 RepID=A0A9P9JBZ6_9HYPO|nr:hypothetical protein B0J13DRAFT_290034 [Dactylonectria estremocensis]